MSSKYYVQQYGRGYSEVLLSKQPMPAKILNSVKHWLTVHGLEFHTVNDATLYVSGKKPGVFMSKGEGYSHILARKPNDDSFWDIQIRSTEYLSDLKDMLTCDNVEGILRYMNSHRPTMDFDIFRETHSRLEAELQKKQDEEDRIKTLELQRQKEEEERKHIDAMQMAAVEFLKGDEIGGNTFCNLLKLHGLWSGVHPKTKHFIQLNLVGVQNDGQYRYLPYANQRNRRRSQGSSMVSDLARRLNTLLEAAPTPETLNSAFNSVQRAA